MRLWTMEWFQLFVFKINFFNYNILYINCEKLSGGAMKFTEKNMQICIQHNKNPPI